MNENMPHTPHTVITLRVAEEADRTIWVTESHRTVVRRVNEAKANGGLATFSRVQGLGKPPVAFATQPSNIMNVAELRS